MQLLADLSHVWGRAYLSIPLDAEPEQVRFWRQALVDEGRAVDCPEWDMGDLDVPPQDAQNWRHKSMSASGGLVIPPLPGWSCCLRVAADKALAAKYVKPIVHWRHSL